MTPEHDPIRDAAELENTAQMLYRVWASGARNPEPWWNIMPSAMKGWREVAKLYLQNSHECPECG